MTQLAPKRARAARSAAVDATLTANLLELAGFGLIVAFLGFIWVPLVLLGAGAVAVGYANSASLTGPGRIGRAIGAARKEWRLQRDEVDPR